MNREITTKTIGKLTQDKNFSDWWESSEIEIPFFDSQKLSIIFMDFEPENDETFLVEADNALINFLNLTIQDKFSISELAYNNCMEFLDAVEFDEADEELRKIKMKYGTLFIQPKSIFLEDIEEIMIFMYRLLVNVTGKKNTDFNWFFDKENNLHE